jgi:hypothetical protein
MSHSPAVVPTAPRSRLGRWIALLALGYIAAGALLVRDYAVQSRTATQAQASHQATGAGPSFAGR